MPNLTQLPDQPLLIVSIIVVAVTGIGGWLYASRGVTQPAFRRTRRVRAPRVVVHEDELPTRTLQMANAFGETDPRMKTAVAAQTNGRQARRRRRRGALLA